jgi:Fe2+ transport system protein B
MKKILIVLSLLSSMFFVACSGGVKAEEGKSIAEIKTEAEKLDASSLRAKALEYKDAIMEKAKELSKHEEALKAIPVADLLGDEAGKIKKNIEEVASSLKSLRDRYAVYYGLLKEKAGDLTGLDSQVK